MGTGELTWFLVSRNWAACTITWPRSFSWGLVAAESKPTSRSLLDYMPVYERLRSRRDYREHVKADHRYRSCLLHRFVKNEWRVLASQTIGVEFASKIVKVGTGARRKRIKLQVGNRLTGFRGRGDVPC
jgi:hypothetical protein